MPNQQIRRPARVTLLAILSALVAAWNAIRIVSAFFYADTLQEFNAHPAYLALTGFIGLATASVACWGLGRGSRLGWWTTLIASIGFPAWYWVDRLFLQGQRANWPFVLFGTLLFPALILIALFSPTTRIYMK